MELTFISFSSKRFRSYSTILFSKYLASTAIAFSIEGASSWGISSWRYVSKLITPLYLTSFRVSRTLSQSMFPVYGILCRSSSPKLSWRWRASILFPSIPMYSFWSLPVICKWPISKQRAKSFSHAFSFRLSINSTASLGSEQHPSAVYLFLFSLFPY